MRERKREWGSRYYATGSPCLTLFVVDPPDHFEPDGRAGATDR